jgi:acetate kinase
VAVFDTAFHATLPETARRYPVPAAWDAWGIRRYGFHGLSVAWSVERAGQLLGRPAADIGLVVAHLGNGCSVTAVSRGRSVATSMGMTPLEGLMMGTRSGSIDPGILLAVVRDRRLSLDELSEVLDHGSGLLGVSGSAGDMRALQAASDGGDAAAALALEMFVDRAAAGIAAAATALRRLDAIVFTGGIGEGAGRVRSAIVDRLAVLGVASIGRDETGTDRLLGGGGDRPAVLRIEAREDVVAARAALTILGLHPGAA